MQPQHHLRVSICGDFRMGCTIKTACKTTIPMAQIAYISSNGSKTCSGSSILTGSYFTILKTVVYDAVSMPILMFFQSSKFLKKPRFINGRYSGTKCQTALAGITPILTLAKPNGFTPFCCFVQKYYRFNTFPGAPRAVVFICAKTPSFKHAV